MLLILGRSIAPEIPLNARVVSNIFLILSEFVMLLSAAKINISSSSIIPEEFELPPVFLVSLKLASTFFFSYCNFKLFHFFLISSPPLLLPFIEFTLVAMSFHSCLLFLFMSALFPELTQFHLWVWTPPLSSNYSFLMLFPLFFQ